MPKGWYPPNRPPNQIYKPEYPILVNHDDVGRWGAYTAPAGGTYFGFKVGTDGGERNAVWLERIDPLGNLLGTFPGGAKIGVGTGSLGFGGIIIMRIM